jgi:hypothetical protein
LYRRSPVLRRERVGFLDRRRDFGQEQIETLIHEIGHVFVLRHFFANSSWTAWASEIFGVHSKFTIMNHRPNSRLTDEDLTDLKRLYQLAWIGALTNVNGTAIRLVKPFHEIGQPIDDIFAIRESRILAVPQPVASAQRA